MADLTRPPRRALVLIGFMGAGKSTVAMHLATALARMGHRVGTLDLDLRQRSLGRYIENRSRCSRQRPAAVSNGKSVSCRAELRLIRSHELGQVRRRRPELRTNPLNHCRSLGDSNPCFRRERPTGKRCTSWPLGQRAR